MTMGLGGSMGVYPVSVVCLADEDRGGLYRSSNDWSPRMRGVAGGANRQVRYYELWRPSGFSPDNAGVMGCDWYVVDEWEFPSVGEGGVRSSYFVKGQVVDATGVAQTGVTIMLFRTSDNLYIATGYSDSNGNYSIPTPYSGVSHYVVAYSGSAAGTTVNSLTPSSTPW